MCAVPLTCHRAFTLVAVLLSSLGNDCAVLGGSGGHGVPRLGLCDVHAAARIVHGRAQRRRTGGGDQSDQDSQRDNQQFEPVDTTHRRITPACAQNPPSVDIFDAVHDHSLVETGGSPAGDGCAGCGVVVGDPESIG